MDDDGLLSLLIGVGVVYWIWQGFLFIAPYLLVIFVGAVLIGLLYLAVVVYKKKKRKTVMKDLVVPDILYSEIASNNGDRSYIENFLIKHGLKMRNNVTEEELRGLKLEIEKWTASKLATMEVERQREILRILKNDSEIKNIELLKAQEALKEEVAERRLTERAIEDEIKDRDRRNKIGKD